MRARLACEPTKDARAAAADARPDGAVVEGGLFDAGESGYQGRAPWLSEDVIEAATQQALVRREATRHQQREPFGLSGDLVEAEGRLEYFAGATCLKLAVRVDESDMQPVRYEYGDGVAFTRGDDQSTEQARGDVVAVRSATGGGLPCAGSSVERLGWLWRRQR